MRGIGEIKTPVTQWTWLPDFFIETTLGLHALCSYSSSYSQTVLQSLPSKADFISSSVLILILTFSRLLGWQFSQNLWWLLIEPHSYSWDFVEIVWHMSIGFLVKGPWLYYDLFLFIFPDWNGNQTNKSLFPKLISLLGTQWNCSTKQRDALPEIKVLLSQWETGYCPVTKGSFTKAGVTEDE